MRTRIVAIIAALALGAAAAPVAAQPPSQAAKAAAVAATAKKCSRGYTHARIGGKHKCLRRGQYCARRYDRQYHRYGFHCHRRDRNGDYHLT